MNYMKIFGSFVLVYLLLSCFGCGSGSKTSDSKVTPYEDIYGSNEIDITKALKAVKEQVQRFKSAVASEDKRHIFVVSGGRFLSKLQDFKVTKDGVKFRNTIVEFSDNDIVDVVPLKNGKLLYRIDVPVSIAYIYIYDYILERPLSFYHIEYNYGTKDIIDIDTSGKFFTVDGLYVDLKNLYQEIRPSQRQIYRDDTKNVVIDPLNHLVWQDDEDVSTKTFLPSDAQQVCKEKDGYKWRLPTFDDFHALITHYPQTFRDTLFQNHFYSSNEFESSSYIVQTNLSFSSGVGSYSFSSHEDTYSTKKEGFTFDKYGQNHRYYIRCVADIY